MLKKIGIPLMALAGMLAFVTPPKVDAKIRFGVALGGPIYTTPVPAYSYGYTYPYPHGPGYYAGAVYPYNYGYAYQAPYYGGFSFGWGGHHVDHDHSRGRAEHFDGHRR